MNAGLNNDQAKKSKTFQALHKMSGTFVMPCAWDPLSAIIFEELGFRCVGTTSGGVNWANGRRDYVYSVPREEMLGQYAAIAGATSLPVSADLENGYGDSPDEVAQTVQRSIELGLAGGSIEDQDIRAKDRLYDLELAVERISAAREAAESSGLVYTLTARCEIYSFAAEDPYAIAVERLNRYREAGADCLFVPGISDIQTLKRLVQDVDGPVSFGMGASEKPLTVAELAESGVRRISTGGGLARAMFTQLRTAAKAIQTDGTFGYLENAISDPAINAYLDKHASQTMKP